MYCELKNKDVELVEVKRIKAGNREIIFKQCTGTYFYIGEQRLIKNCDKTRDDKCLLNMDSKKQAL